MAYLRSFLPILIITMSGCAQYHPLPVDEKDIVSRLQKDGESRGLLTAANQVDAIANLKTYSEWYFKKYADYKEHQFNWSDTSLGFGIAGLAAGIAKSPEGAAAGALLASTAKMPGDRYQLTVQATNYEKASDTMSCMHDYLVPLQSNLNTVPSVHFINERIKETRLKLRKAQASINLVSPNLAELEKALRAVIEQKSNKDNTEELIGTRGITQAQLEEETKLLAEKELIACVAAFGE